MMSPNLNSIGENMNGKNLYFLIRVVITIIAFGLFVIHLIFPNFKLDNISIVLLIIGIIPWLNVIFERIEIFGFKGYFKKQDIANDHFPPEIKAIETEVEFNKSKEFTEHSKGRWNFLSLKARIYYPSVAGAQYLMKIYVNDELITNDALINKQADYKYIHGRIYKWYDEKLKSWSVVYSPDFISNYSHNIYKIINGDPYIFIFDISKIKDEKGEYKIKVEHNGLDHQNQFKNSLIVRDIQVFS